MQVRTRGFLLYYKWDMNLLIYICLINRCLSEGYLEYLSRTDDTSWTPDLAYYCSLIGRLVDSILCFVCFLNNHDSKMEVFHHLAKVCLDALSLGFFMEANCKLLMSTVGELSCNSFGQPVNLCWRHCLHFCWVAYKLTHRRHLRIHKLICAIFSSLQAITRRCGSVYLDVVVLGVVKFFMCIRDVWVV